MAKRCPPGVLCIENVTIVAILFFITILFYLAFKMSSLPTNINKNQERENIVYIDTNTSNTDLYNRQNTQFSNTPNDVFMNPYAPPLKNNPFYNPTNIPDIRGRVPINVPTSNYDLNYTQVGIAVRNSGTETILPLFGRPLHANRNKWQYYTMAGSNNIKLPVSKGGRNCTGTIGCDELYNGETIYVEGYNDSFNVTIYENSEPRYIPYL